MSKFLLVAAVVALAACGEKKVYGTPADTAAAAAPAPAAPATDTTVMPHDSTAMAGDTTKAH